MEEFPSHEALGPLDRLRALAATAFWEVASFGSAISPAPVTDTSLQEAVEANRLVRQERRGLDREIADLLGNQ